MILKFSFFSASDAMLTANDCIDSHGDDDWGSIAPH